MHDCSRGVRRCTVSCMEIFIKVENLRITFLFLNVNRKSIIISFITLYFDVVNDETFDKAIAFAADNNKYSVELKFTDEKLLSQASAYIEEENSNLYNLFQSNGVETGVNFYYGSIEDMNVIYLDI